MKAKVLVTYHPNPAALLFSPYLMKVIKAGGPVDIHFGLTKVLLPLTTALTLLHQNQFKRKMLMKTNIQMMK